METNLISKMEIENLLEQQNYGERYEYDSPDIETGFRLSVFYHYQTGVSITVNLIKNYHIVSTKGERGIEIYSAEHFELIVLKLTKQLKKLDIQEEINNLCQIEKTFQNEFEKRLPTIVGSDKQIPLAVENRNIMIKEIKKMSIFLKALERNEKIDFNCDDFLQLKQLIKQFAVLIEQNSSAKYFLGNFSKPTFERLRTELLDMFKITRREYPNRLAERKAILMRLALKVSNKKDEQVESLLMKGSEKQVLWAQEIRKEFNDLIPALACEIFGSNFPKYRNNDFWTYNDYSEIIKKIENVLIGFLKENNSKWWIDNNNDWTGICWSKKDFHDDYDIYKKYKEK